MVVRGQAGASSYVISAMHEGRQGTRIKAILYARGCAIETLDFPLSAANNQQYFFVCRPLPNISVAGSVTSAERLYGREVILEAQYVARWAGSFLGLDSDIALEIPVGDAAPVGTDGHFRMSIPDLAQDPFAGVPQNSGELRILAKDRISGDTVAQLIPGERQGLATRLGDLVIQSEYPSETVFAACSPNRSPIHDSFGFAQRPDPSDVCLR